MAKMGSSTYTAYCGAQIVGAVGRSRSLIDQYCAGTASSIEGINVFEVAEEAIRLHQRAFGNDPVLETMLDAGGEYVLGVHGGGQVPPVYSFPCSSAGACDPRVRHDQANAA